MASQHNHKSLEPFTERVESGLYDDIAQNILDLGKTFFGAAEYKVDFDKFVVSWSGNTKFQATNNGRGNGQDILFNMFGQIASHEVGTLISAAGNHNFEGANNEFIPITDSVKVRDYLILECPTFAPPLLEKMFCNQIATYNEVRAYDESEEYNTGQQPFVKEAIKCSNPDAADAVGDMIGIHMPAKYEAPATATTKTFKRVEKQALNTVEVTVEPSSSNASSSTATSTSDKNSVPTSDDIKLGALYDPDLLPDHRGPCFEHKKSKLVQQDIRDIDDNLIPPWKVYDTLRPGTLVLINVSMHVFLFKSPGRRDRKLYQIHAHKLRVLATSHLPVYPRSIPKKPGNTSSFYAQATSSVSPQMLPKTDIFDATASFANFRKRKLAEIQDTKEADAEEDLAQSGAKGKGKKKEAGESSAKTRRIGRPKAERADAIDAMEVE